MLQLFNVIVYQINTSVIIINPYRLFCFLIVYHFNELVCHHQRALLLIYKYSADVNVGDIYFIGSFDPKGLFVSIIVKLARFHSAPP